MSSKMMTNSSSQQVFSLPKILSTNSATNDVSSTHKIDSVAHKTVNESAALARKRRKEIILSQRKAAAAVAATSSSSVPFETKSKPLSSYNPSSEVVVNSALPQSRPFTSSITPHNVTSENYINYKVPPKKRKISAESGELEKDASTFIGTDGGDLFVVDKDRNDAGVATIIPNSVASPTGRMNLNHLAVLEQAAVTSAAEVAAAVAIMNVPKEGTLANNVVYGNSVYGNNHTISIGTDSGTLGLADLSAAASTVGIGNTYNDTNDCNSTTRTNPSFAVSGSTFNNTTEMMKESAEKCSDNKIIMPQVSIPLTPISVTSSNQVGATGTNVQPSIGTTWIPCKQSKKTVIKPNKMEKQNCKVNTSKNKVSNASKSVQDVNISIKNENEDSTTNLKQIRYDPETPMTKEQLTAWRKEARRVRNRQSAAASRQKIRNRIEELEDEVEGWKKRYSDVLNRLKTLEDAFDSRM